MTPDNAAGSHVATGLSARRSRTAVPAERAFSGACAVSVGGV